MKFVSYKQLFTTISLNSWKIKQLKPKGIIGVPRSGLMTAIMLSEEIHVGTCSPAEFFDANGQEYVFWRHGKRPLEHNDNGPIIIMEDTCYHGSFGRLVDILRRQFPNEQFISCCVYLEGPCDQYKPDLWLEDIRKEALADKEMPLALYQWNIIDSWFNFKFLFDIDGVICLNPPQDTDIEAYEDYLMHPTPLHIPSTPSGNQLTFCSYRLNKYRKLTEDFLKSQNIPVKDIIMYNAETITERNKVSPGTYKGHVYRNSNFKLFIESNDQEAQEICKVSGKPVYCFETGRMWHR